MKTLTEQLNREFVKSGLSVGELLIRSGLTVSRASLSRKLRGKLRLNIDEAEAIAPVLDQQVILQPRRSRRHKATRVAA